MKKILLVSDNHGFHAHELLTYIDHCDQIWHAGDIGNPESLELFLSSGKPFRAVYGNIDSPQIRYEYPESLSFSEEGLKICMLHIGGYPGKYSRLAKSLIASEKPDLLISGHSHILKVMPDEKNKLLHMNPGSYGHQGFHIIRTALIFQIEQKKISNLNAIELGKRGIL